MVVTTEVAALPSRVEAERAVIEARATLAKAGARVRELEAEAGEAREAQARGLAKAGDELADGSGGSVASLGDELAKVAARVQVLDVATAAGRRREAEAGEAVAVAEGIACHVRALDAALALEALNLRVARAVAGLSTLHDDWSEASRELADASAAAVACAPVLERATGRAWPVAGVRVSGPMGLGRVVDTWRQHLLPEYRRQAWALHQDGHLAAVEKRGGGPLPSPDEWRKDPDGNAPPGVMARVRQVLASVAEAVP